MISFSKRLILSFFSVFSLIYACSSSNSIKALNVDFTEERRLNYDLNLEEVTVINTSQELVELYGKLHDPEIPRSAPIPTFDENTESILVIKPILRNLTYGDIEIQSIEKSNSKLKINYREIESWEFAENKWNDPIVIVRVSEKPSEIKLNKIN